MVYERKWLMDKKRVIALVLCAVLLLGAALTGLFVPDGRLIRHGDTDCLYPYTLRQNGDGSVTVTIKGRKEPCRWQCGVDESSAVAIVSREEKENESIFVIAPVFGKPTENVVFYLVDGENTEDAVYSIHVDMSVVSGADLTVLGTGHNEPDERERFYSGSDISYYITSNDNGKAVIVVEDTQSASDWYAQYDIDLPISVEKEKKNDTTVAFTVTCDSGVGYLPVSLVKEGSTEKISFDVSGVMGITKITAHTFGEPLMVEYESASDISATDVSAADVVIGDDLAL